MRSGPATPQDRVCTRQTPHPISLTRWSAKVSGEAGQAPHRRVAARRRLWASTARKAAATNKTPAASTRTGAPSAAPPVCGAAAPGVLPSVGGVVAVPAVGGVGGGVVVVSSVGGVGGGVVVVTSAGGVLGGMVGEGCGGVDEPLRDGLGEGLGGVTSGVAAAMVCRTGREQMPAPGFSPPTCTTTETTCASVNWSPRLIWPSLFWSTVRPSTWIGFRPARGVTPSPGVRSYRQTQTGELASAAWAGAPLTRMPNATTVAAAPTKNKR